MYWPRQARPSQGIQKHHRHHDQQFGLDAPARRDRRKRAYFRNGAQRGDEDPAGQLPPRVPQPHRRNRAFQAPDPRRDHRRGRVAGEGVAGAAGAQGIVLEIGKEAEEFIAKEGYDPVYGARPLKRFIQQHLETPLSQKIISGELAEGSVAQVTVEDGALAIR